MNKSIKTFVTVFLASTTTLVPATAEATRQCPTIYAHTGVTAHHDRNTIGAIDAAYRLGVGAELDVQPDKDGGIVLVHSPTLDPATNGTGNVWDRTSRYIRGLHTHDGEPVAFWKDYLDHLAAASHRRGLVELKSSPAWKHSVVDHLLTMAADRHLLGRLTVFSRDEHLLTAVHTLRPGVETAEKGRWWLWPADRVQQYADSVVTTRRYSQTNVDALHESGGHVYLHGNGPVAWRATLRKSGDGIVAHKVRALLSWCQ